MLCGRLFPKAFLGPVDNRIKSAAARAGRWRGLRGELEKVGDRP